MHWKQLSAVLGLMLLAGWTLPANAQAPKTKVILLGVFHFHNPGADAAQFGQVDILSEKPQQELEKITRVIAKLGPDRIMLEQDVQHRAAFDTILANYSAQTLRTETNEIVQIGFRLKSQVPAATVHYVDCAMNLPFDSLVYTWQSSGQQQYFDHFMGMIKKIENDFDQQTKSGMSLTARLKSMNTAAYRQHALAFYTLPEIMNAGKPGNYIGADVAAEWYKRNIRIFSNIVRELKGDEKCIFVMFGAAHIPILEHLFRLHGDRYEIVDLNSRL